MYESLDLIKVYFASKKIGHLIFGVQSVYPSISPGFTFLAGDIRTTPPSE